VLIFAAYLSRRPDLAVHHGPRHVAIAHHLLAITLWSYALFGNARMLSAIMISSGTVVAPTF
jgi:hypothetical protein